MGTVLISLSVGYVLGFNGGDRLDERRMDNG
jgi:hypothetical protein